MLMCMMRRPGAAFLDIIESKFPTFLEGTESTFTEWIKRRQVVVEDTNFVAFVVYACEKTH